MSHTARLIEDLGLEASDTEFFRSAEFFAAEGVTHTLAIGDVMRLPVIVREIEDVGRVDAISPYGYPGAHLLDPQAPGSEALDAQQIDWSETGLVSVFVRDRIGESRSFAGGTVRNVVQIAEGDAGIRKRLREQIRRNERGAVSPAHSPFSAIATCTTTSGARRTMRSATRR